MSHLCCCICGKYPSIKFKGKSKKSKKEQIFRTCWREDCKLKAIMKMLELGLRIMTKRGRRRK